MKFSEHAQVGKLQGRKGNGLFKVRGFSGQHDAGQELPASTGGPQLPRGQSQNLPGAAQQVFLGQLLTQQLHLWEKKERNLSQSETPGHSRRRWLYWGQLGALRVKAPFFFFLFYLFFFNAGQEMS